MKVTFRVFALVLFWTVATWSWASVINSTTVSGNQLIITGTGFTGAPTVTFNGAKIVVVSSSATQIIATLNPVPPPGTYRLVVKASAASATSYVAISAAPNIVAQLALQGQTGPIAKTPFFTPSATGMFLVSSYFTVVSDTETQGQIYSYLWYTDDVSDTEHCMAGAWSTQGNVGSGGTTCVIRVIGGTPVTYDAEFYNVQGGSIDYELFITVTQLQ